MIKGILYVDLHIKYVQKRKPLHINNDLLFHFMHHVWVDYIESKKKPAGLLGASY